MATDFISRDAAIEAIRSECVGCVGQQFGERFCSKCAIRQREVALYSVPAADVRPVVRSEWEFRSTNDLASKAWTCPECGQRKVFKTNFCPKCGADMRKVAESEQVKEGAE